MALVYIFRPDGFWISEDLLGDKPKRPRQQISPWEKIRDELAKGLDKKNLPLIEFWSTG